ncbi:putative O-linked N-acetylglucosamine transferase (SPINDLY family) [Azospirillum agricola]|uniref:tetratricopeptide repeat protein n=1 Tax=Azospirillum agricola TaxID=1720247 RepID=UPI001AE5FB85|nr:glycosyltransferase family 41 protein [Azospirillum agricola]MBP2227014.1 putative O-linked N-acetylglucosamine transferase (SPINDLY family) [Azospirillum agricola]
MASIREALLAALDHLEAGRLAEAETLCDRILGADPTQADAWRLAGLAAARAGRMGDARHRLAVAIRHAPNRNDLRLNHAATLAASGLPQAGALRLTLALEPARDDLWKSLADAAAREESAPATIGPWRALAGLRPDEAALRYNLGVALQDSGRPREAAAAYAGATRLAPLLEEAHFNRANALRDIGDRPAAARCYRAALAAAPAMLGAARNLGLLLMPADPPAAAAAFRIAARAEPEQPEGTLDLAAALLAAGRPAEALAAFDEALERDPGRAAGHDGRALALRELGRAGDGHRARTRALALDPGLAEAWVNQAQGWIDRGRPSAAVIDSRRALRLRPGYPAALDALARSLHAAGRPERAMTVLRRLIALTPAPARALHSNLLLIRQSDPSAGPAALLAEHRRWARLHAPPPGASPPPVPRGETAGPLRIGYLSADFRTHSVGTFFAPLLAAHDRGTVRTVCYDAALSRPDATTARLRERADDWREVAGLGDAALADRIRADRIDALIDLGGHTADSRLGVLALAPAPVRLTALGYPGTTGLALEGRLTDPIIEPPDHAPWSSEPPIPLPDGFLRYQPPDDAPEPRPRDGREPVTFGSFNTLGKLTPAVIAAWTDILSTLPESRLLLKAPGLTDPAVRDDLRARFVDGGIAADRLELIGWVASRAGHLALYQRIDVGLDPFPYNGTTTTCEALWMGVPVVTLAGDRHAARVGAALLTRVGLPDLIAATLEDYGRIAATLAADSTRLARLRLELRDRMRDGPLGDAAGLARAVEAACRDLLAAARRR